MQGVRLSGSQALLDVAGLVAVTPGLDIAFDPLHLEQVGNGRDPAVRQRVQRLLDAGIMQVVTREHG